jgi:hypothetical protein
MKNRGSLLRNLLPSANRFGTDKLGLVLAFLVTREDRPDCSLVISINPVVSFYT